MWWLSENCSVNYSCLLMLEEEAGPFSLVSLSDFSQRTSHLLSNPIPDERMGVEVKSHSKCTLKREESLWDNTKFAPLLPILVLGPFKIDFIYYLSRK